MQILRTCESKVYQNISLGLTVKEDFGGAESFSTQIWVLYINGPLRGKADQSFAPAAVSQLKVSTPGGGFVVLLLSPPKQTEEAHIYCIQFQSNISK